MLAIPSTSREYLHLPVTGDHTTDMPVAVAFVAATAEPTSGDWRTAEWHEGTARLLIGPGSDNVLAEGVYRVWVRVTATPEIPVLRFGLLQVT